MLTQMPVMSSFISRVSTRWTSSSLPAVPGFLKGQSAARRHTYSITKCMKMDIATGRTEDAGGAFTGWLGCCLFGSRTELEDQTSQDDIAALRDGGRRRWVTRRRLRERLRRLTIRTIDGDSLGLAVSPPPPPWIFNATRSCWA